MSGRDIKVAICIPTAGTVAAWFAHSLAGLCAYGNSLAARPGEASIEVRLFIQETSVIHANREGLVWEARRWGATHVMFLDDDMLFDVRVLTILLGRRHPFVACNYPKRGWPITFTGVRLDEKATIHTGKESTGLEEAYYCGFGVSLIEMQVFEKTPQPWFLPMWLPKPEHPNGGEYTTEDRPFCERVRAAGFNVYVDHDASKLVGHRGAHTYQWDQWQPAPTQAGPQSTADVIPLKEAKA